ncbi:DOMON domain-containing protein [Methanogenium sp. S4BF]|uniref:DOMON domain-containing protein n=1 Tax=Methanogenium sp. S4BF TaxID=1789226 RepID=UPI002416947C|nr:DOMON domain-containing protein [Methanogenium sp. S4BF]WFN34822.1 DOMON domain-containing protein [Methanogenium sp. S4BF]
MDAVKICAVFLLIVAVAGCSDEIPPDTTIEESQGFYPWSPDGVIAEDEYAKSLSVNDGNFVIHWRFVNETIFLGLETTSSGWAGIGFEPTNRMKDADIILGGTVDGIPYIYDMFSTGITGPHPRDTELGGTFDILEFNAIEQADGTVVEFSRRTDTKDPYDKVLAAGTEVTIIWAQADTDAPLFKHNTGKGSETIIL